jgi:hypothetical protein
MTVSEGFGYLVYQSHTVGSQYLKGTLKGSNVLGRPDDVQPAGELLGVISFESGTVICAVGSMDGQSVSAGNETNYFITDLKSAE